MVFLQSQFPGSSNFLAHRACEPARQSATTGRERKRNVHCYRHCVWRARFLPFLVPRVLLRHTALLRKEIRPPSCLVCQAICEEYGDVDQVPMALSFQGHCSQKYPWIPGDPGYYLFFYAWPLSKSLSFTFTTTYPYHLRNQSPYVFMHLLKSWCSNIFFEIGMFSSKTTTALAAIGPPRTHIRSPAGPRTSMQSEQDFSTKVKVRACATYRCRCVCLYVMRPRT